MSGGYLEQLDRLSAEANFLRHAAEVRDEDVEGLRGRLEEIRLARIELAQRVHGNDLDAIDRGCRPACR
jgi:hypothetical protein